MSSKITKFVSRNPTNLTHLFNMYPLPFECVWTSLCCIVRGVRNLINLAFTWRESSGINPLKILFRSSSSTWRRKLTWLIFLALIKMSAIYTRTYVMLQQHGLCRVSSPKKVNNLGMLSLSLFSRVSLSSTLKIRWGQSCGKLYQVVKHLLPHKLNFGSEKLIPKYLIANFYNY